MSISTVWPLTKLIRVISVRRWVCGSHLLPQRRNEGGTTVRQHKDSNSLIVDQINNQKKTSPQPQWATFDDTLKGLGLPLIAGITAVHVTLMTQSRRQGLAARRPPDKLERPRRVGEHRKEAAGNLNAKKATRHHTEPHSEPRPNRHHKYASHEGATFKTSPKSRVMSTRLRRWKLLRLRDHDLGEF